MSVRPTVLLLRATESNFDLPVARCLAFGTGFKVHVLHLQDRSAGKRLFEPSQFSSVVESYRKISAPSGLGEAAEEIIRQVARTKADVLLPVDEGAVGMAGFLREDLAGQVALPPLPAPWAFRTANDKGLLAGHLAQWNIAGPLTISGTDVPKLEAVLSESESPFLLKPRIGQSGEGIIRFDNGGALLAYLTRPRQDHDDYVVQEYFPGQDLGCGLFCLGGKIRAHIFHRPFGPKESPFAYAKNIEFVDDEPGLAVVEKLMASLDWEGVGNVDLRASIDGRERMVLEINPRFWASVAKSLSAGINFPHLACLAALGEDLPLGHRRQARFLTGATALKHGLDRLTGRSNGFPVRTESQWKFFLADPWPKVAALADNLTRRVLRWSRSRPNSGRNTAGPELFRADPASPAAAPKNDVRESSILPR